MEKHYTRYLSLFLKLILVITFLTFPAASVWASTTGVVTEHFADETPGSSTFTTSSIAFTLGGNWSVSNVAAYGWTGSEPDNYFVDNYSALLAAPGVVGAIQIDPAATFQTHELYIFPGNDGDYVSQEGNVVIRGSLGGTVQFTHTILGENINIYGHTNGGWTYVDLSSYSANSIDKLEFELTGNLRYLAVDAFKHESTLNNAAPTDIALSASTIAENAGAGTEIGTFSTTDADAGDTHTYSLVAGVGSEDNALFTIDGSSLRLGPTALDYETKASLSCRIRTTDAAGAYDEKAFSITVEDIYEAPVIAKATLVVDENSGASVVSSAELKTTVNADLSAAYTLTAPPHKGVLKKSGSTINTGENFTQDDIDANLITYTPNENANGADGFTFSVTDGSDTLSDNTFTIDITSVNDPPVVAANTGATADEGGSVDIIPTMLQVTDTESSAAALTFTVSTAPVNGTLYESGTELSAGGTFTQEDIDNSRITYTHNGGETLADSFVFTVSDGEGGTVGATVFSFVIDPLNDDPTMSGLPSDITVLENTASNVDLSAASFSDADSGASAVTLTLSVSSGSLSAASGGGVTVSGSGTAAITLTGTAANIDTFLNTASNIMYTGAENSHGNDAATLTLSAHDGGSTGTGGGGDVALGTVNIDITATPPNVTSVSSTKEDGSYGIGTAIEITITFSDSVTVAGIPQLELETGTVDRTANYTGGSGSNTLTFLYITQSGDETADLDYQATHSLVLSGGTIQRGDSNAVLTLPVPGAANSLGANQAIIIEAFPIVSLSVGSQNIAENGGTSTITAALSQTSSQDVTVTLSYAGTATSATDYNGTASTTITIPAGSLSAQTATGITALQDTDIEGNETIVIDITGVAKGFENGVQKSTITILDDDIPQVVDVSSSTANGTYKAGDVIAVTVMFSHPVTVTGTPQLLLETGSTDRTVHYISGSGTTSLVFNYTVSPGDASSDLDYKGTDSLALNGGTITSGGIDASLVLPAPGSVNSLAGNKAIVVNTTPPTAGIVVTDTALRTGETSPVTISFSQAVTGFDNFDLTVDNGTLTAVSSSDGGLTYTAELAPAADTEAASNVIVLDNTGVMDAAGNTGTGTTVSNQYAIDTRHPTADVDMSKSALYSGETCAVTVTFSEAVTGFDNSDLTVDNGSLTAVGSSDGGTTYTATFAADDVNDDTNTIVLNLTGITDAAGNTGTGTVSSANYTVAKPTVPGAPTGVTATAGNGQATVSFTPPVSDGGAAITEYTVTAAPGGNSATGAASPITVTGLTNGTAYTFTVTAINSVGTGAASAPSSSVTPQAAQTPSSGGSGGNSSASQPTYHADVKAGASSKSTLPVAVDRNSGSASVDIGSQSNIISGAKTATITVPAIPNVSSYTLGIPVPDLSTTGTQGTLTVNTHKGSLTLPSNMLTGREGSDGDRAQITIGAVHKSNLPAEVRASVCDRPLIRLTLSIDGRQAEWNNPQAPVTVSIPYTPTAAELNHPESIVVWYIDGFGNAVCVPNGSYDPVLGMVAFRTTHFSDYAVAYNQVSFNDVSESDWYYRAVSFIAAREISGGTGKGGFSPKLNLTRGELLVLMMRAYDIAPDKNPADNFSDAGNTYYTGYLAAAKRLGISAGIGNNRYAPDREITRQEMCALLVNILRSMGQLPEGSSGQALSDFSDADQVAAWAKDATSLLIETGTIGGSDEGKLAPHSITNRAEIAQVLYRLLSK